MERKVTVREAGRRGGLARVKAQTEAERSASASRAAKVRWAKWREERKAARRLTKRSVKGDGQAGHMGNP